MNQTESANRLHFHGFHAIIAMPTIDNEKRVLMVANDLRKIARVPFECAFLLDFISQEMLICQQPYQTVALVQF